MNLEKAQSIFQKFYDLDQNFYLAGSARRGKLEDLHDVDLIYLGESIPEIPFAEEYKQKGTVKQVVTVDGEQVDIYRSEKSHFGAMLFFLTGPGFFNVKMRGIAKRRKMKLTQYGFFDLEGNSLGDFENEESMFTKLKMSYIEPSNRK